MQGYRLIIDLKEPCVVYRRTAQQAEQFHGLDGEQGDDAPHPLRRQVADRDEQQPITSIEHQDVAIVERHVDDAKHEEQAHAPGKPAGE